MNVGFWGEQLRYEMETLRDVSVEFWEKLQNRYMQQRTRWNSEFSEMSDERNINKNVIIARCKLGSEEEGGGGSKLQDVNVELWNVSSEFWEIKSKLQEANAILEGGGGGNKC